MLLFQINKYLVFCKLKSFRHIYGCSVFSRFTSRTTDFEKLCCGMCVYIYSNLKMFIVYGEGGKRTFLRANLRSLWINFTNIRERPQGVDRNQFEKNRLKKPRFLTDSRVLHGHVYNIFEQLPNHWSVVNVMKLVAVVVSAINPPYRYRGQGLVVFRVCFL